MENGLDKVVINNTLFLFPDIMEGLLLDVEKLYRAEGQEFRHQTRQDFNKTLFHLRRFLSSIRDCSAETQDAFGSDSDELKELIFYYIDRVNENPKTAKSILNFIKSKSSKLGFNFKTIGL